LHVIKAGRLLPSHTSAAAGSFHVEHLPLRGRLELNHKYALVYMLDCICC